MARTRLFARLAALVAQHRLSSKRPELALSATSRREFVQHSLLGLTALGALPALSACDGTSAQDSIAGESDQELKKRARVVIVGAGIAGLTCGYRLKQAGVRAEIYDAATRTGGRMFSTKTGFLDGQVAELGGEFIDTNHLTMQALAEELGIQLEDREEKLSAGITRDVWWVDGKAVPEATIVEQFTRIAPLLAELEVQADDEEDDTVFVELDNTSLADWLEANLANEPELKSVLRDAYRGEYGREVEEQSALNLIYLIGSDDPDPFRIFGDSDERFHTSGGSQTFTNKLAAELGSQIALEHKLVRAVGNQRLGYTLHFHTPRGLKLVRADVVVFALPFTLLRRVDLRELKLSDEKRTVIEELGYGTNAKVMGGFTRRPWLEDHQSSGSVTSDEPFQQLWDTSLSQPGNSGILTNFLGGKQGEAAGNGTAEAWYRNVVLPGVNKVWSGAAAAYRDGSAKRMHWPSYPFTRGSYACYAPGQWSFWGTEGLPENKNTLHFCGEHTSLDFQGYMEGAAESGTLSAQAVLDRLGVKASARHAALVHVRSQLPQPALSQRASLTDLRGRRDALTRVVHELARLGSRVG